MGHFPCVNTLPRLTRTPVFPTRRISQRPVESCDGNPLRPIVRDEAANYECGSTLLDRPEASSRSFSMGRYTANSRRCPLALGGAVLVNYVPEGAEYG